MIIKPIQTSWGSTIELTKDEFFEKDFNFWRDLIYDRKILIFKKIEFTKQEYVKFAKRFGSLWDKENYRYSNESAELVYVDDQVNYISPFSNVISKKLMNQSMPWHSDIPNRSFKPFPFRSLWITKNPNPLFSGKTAWMNLELAMDYLSKEELEMAESATVLQQSWYEPGTDIKELSMIKEHPITGKKSLRLNFYNDAEMNRTNAWIIGVKCNGQMQENCYIIRDLLLKLEKIPELIYEHTWDTFDIVVYDNWSFVHKRTALHTGQNGERHFYRINIDHCTNEDWNSNTII